MADVIKQMNDQYDRVMEAGVRKDFGQGLDDVDKDSLLKAVKMVHFPDMDQEDYLSALGQAYGGISIKKPETQRVLGHDFQPNSEQMNVPVLPEVNVTAKGYSHGAVPKTVHSLAGSLAYDLASLPANLASTVRSMAQDISDFHTGKPLRTAADMAPEIEKAKEAGATLGSFVAPELKYASRGEAMVREGGKFVSRYLVEPVVNKFLDHATRFGASQGAIYSGVTSIGEGDSPIDIAKKTLLGGGFGAVLGKAGHNVGLSVKAFREGLSGVQHKAAEALATAGTTPIASTLDRIIKRGLTPTMEHSFADVLGLLKKGRIAASDAAQQILEGLGQKPAPEHVAAFTEHLRHMEPVAPDTFGQHAEDTGMADWHMPGEVPPGAPSSPAPEDPFMQTGKPPLEDIPAADIGATNTDVPDQFGQHQTVMEPYDVPGTAGQNWQSPPEQAPLHEQLPDVHEATVTPPPMGISQKVLDSQVNYPQGYIPWEPSQFNFEGLTPAEQYNLVSRRVAEDAKLRADTGMGPQQPLLPAPGTFESRTGAESNPDLPIWGITTDKISMDGLAIVGEKDANTYIARDHNGMEVEIPKKQTFDPDLKGPDKTIPVPGKSAKDSDALVELAKIPKHERAISAINDITEYMNPMGKRERVIGMTGVEISPTHDGRLHLYSLRAFEPKKGHGTTTMNKLLKIADEHGIEMELDPVPLSTQVKIPKKKLIAWYRSFGFKFKNGLMVRPVGAVGETSAEALARKKGIAKEMFESMPSLRNLKATKRPEGK